MMSLFCSEFSSLSYSRLTIAQKALLFSLVLPLWYLLFLTRSCWLIPCQSHCSPCCSSKYKQLVPSSWTVHVMEKPSQKSRPQPPPPHSEIIILEGSTCLSIKTLTNKLTQRGPQGPWECWEMHNFMTITKSRMNWATQCGHWVTAVTMAWIMPYHIEVRISLSPWTQLSSVFPSAKELAAFIPVLSH